MCHATCPDQGFFTTGFTENNIVVATADKLVDDGIEHFFDFSTMNRSALFDFQNLDEVYERVKPVAFCSLRACFIRQNARKLVAQGKQGTESTILDFIPVLSSSP